MGSFWLATYFWLTNAADFTVDENRNNIVSRGDMQFELVSGTPSRVQCVVFAESDAKRDVLLAQMISVGWKQIADFILESPLCGVQIKIE